MKNIIHNLLFIYLFSTVRPVCPVDNSTKLVGLIGVAMAGGAIYYKASDNKKKKYEAAIKDLADLEKEMKAHDDKYVKNREAHLGFVEAIDELIHAGKDLKLSPTDASQIKKTVDASWFKNKFFVSLLIKLPGGQEWLYYQECKMAQSLLKAHFEKVDEFEQKRQQTVMCLDSHNWPMVEYIKNFSPDADDIENMITEKNKYSVLSEEFFKSAQIYKNSMEEQIKEKNNIINDYLKKD